MITTGLITISDRAFSGAYQDASGPALREYVLGRGWNVTVEQLVPDDIAAIQEAVRAGIQKSCQLILTTGGTGISQRDITPEAIRGIARRELPGFGEVMRAESRRVTPHAILSRCLAVVVDRSLVVCLPGKPEGAVECLDFVAEAIPHCVEILRETQ